MMKKKFIQTVLLLIYSCGAVTVFGQIKRLNDPSIVAQHKRMVFE